MAATTALVVAAGSMAYGATRKPPSAPPPPTPVDPGQSALGYINSMADPVLQGKLLANEQKFRPQYNDLNLQDLERYLLGSKNATGALDLFNQSSLSSANTQAQANTIQRQADINDVNNLGQQATAAFRNANPELQAQMQAAQGLSNGGDPYAALRGQLGGQQPNFGNIGFDPAQASLLGQAPQVGSGQLGDSLYQQALGANGLGQVGQTLQGRAQTLAQSTGQLNPDELRALQQSIRESYASRGTDMSNGAISAEALGRLTNERQRMQEDLAMASGLNQSGQAELMSNRGFAQGVQGADISRQQGNAALMAGYDTSNQDAQNQFGLYNSQAGLATQDSNRAFGAQQYQQNLSNLGLLGQLDASQLGNDRAYALQLAQMQAGIASDPFQAILGRPSGALQYGAGQQGFAGNLTQNMQGPQLFDPNAGINLALQNNANLGNYNANIFGAQAGYAGQVRGASIGALGSLAGAGLAACWVARECYGAENPKWLLFRDWMLNRSPAWFRSLYLRFGERFAKFVSNKPRLKLCIRKWMDSRIAAY